MKTDSDNFRESAIIDIVKDLYDIGIDVIIYEPLTENLKYKSEYGSIKITDNLKEFGLI